MLLIACVTLPTGLQAAQKASDGATPRKPPLASPWRNLPLVTDDKIDAAWAQVGWGGFVLDGGTLRTQCDERGMGLLVYKPERFGDCQIRVVYRCEKPKSNAGVFVRMDDGILARIGEKSPPVSRDANGKLSKEMLAKIQEASEKHLGGWYPVHHGYEVQILDDTDAWHRTGAIYSLTKADAVPEKAQAEWRTMIITLDGERILVEVDGKRLSSFDASAADLPKRTRWSEPEQELRRPTRGYIGLQNHDPGDVVWFKEVSVRPLSSAKCRQPIAPGKFIPTFAVKYAGSTGWPSLEDAARYDLIVIGQGSARSKAHSAIPGNTWQVLKQMNPHLVLLLYQMGISEYNTADWGELGPGWKWIIANHGPKSADRWVAVGDKFGECLQGKRYPNERLMLPGREGWQQFWLDHVYAKYWGTGSTRPEGQASATAIADGIFSDNTQYSLPFLNGWYREGHLDSPDVPVDYYVNGAFDRALYRKEIKSFLARAVPRLENKNLKFALNFGGMAQEQGPADWADLDQQHSGVFTAMEEGAFAHPWTSKGGFAFWPEQRWLQQVQVLRSLRNIRALMNVHGPVESKADDFSRMDASDHANNRAWDVLWFGLASFLMGYDDVRQNGYLNFTVWGYTRFYWFKEFDPQFLHLGSARGEFRRLEGRTGHVYLREFDDGWAVVNPTESRAECVAAPQGEARVIDHEALEQPEARPLVRQFDLPAHRGIVLLKPGRSLGNADNR